jgi:hypothetical protein
MGVHGIGDVASSHAIDLGDSGMKYQSAGRSHPGLE